MRTHLPLIGDTVAPTRRVGHAGHSADAMPSLAIKRGLDVAVSFMGLGILSLPLLLIAVLIKLDSHGPVFFRQWRSGKSGKPFMIWKFRTMTHGSADQGLGVKTARDDTRITRIGRLLRMTSVDETPQFINVLKGDMSIVGPRPTLPYQVERYTATQRKRLDVRPGITSWAAVNGRNRLSWEQRIALDIWYVENRSLWLDLWIMLKSLWVAFVTKEGVYPDQGPNDAFISATTEDRAKNVGEHA